MTKESEEEIVDSIVEQAQDQCKIHDHITRVITNLDINEEWFSGYSEPERAKYDLDAMVSTFLYYYARDIDSYSALERRLKGAAYVYFRLGLSAPLQQQIISHSWRNRFDATERKLIKNAAAGIRMVCDEHDVINKHEPAIEPDDVINNDIGEEQIRSAVQRATDLGLNAFIDPRAENSKYALEAYFERQGYLNLAKAGTTTLSRRFARLSDRSEVPHGSSHNRTMKKIATPDPQTNLWDFQNGDLQNWKGIRDTVLPAFHTGVENILDEIEDGDRSGIREPVNVALDITTWQYWPSPFRDESDVERSEEPVKLKRNDGSIREVYPKEDYPEMVSGIKGSHQRAYKFATLTILPEDTPIVIAIEPVRDKRQWEPDDLDTRSRGALVDRLVEQAEQHVDINKVFADREFDNYGSRHAIDQHDAYYVIPKRKQSIEDNITIEEIKEDPVYDATLKIGELTTAEGESHDISVVYVPKEGNQDEDDDEYMIFTMNAHVSSDRAMALIDQYRDRWMIENEYKTIKKHFLPTSASSDYRNRLLFFVIGVTLYNVWRLSNYLLRDEVDVNLGEDPPILAGEIVELVGFCLFDPGS